MHEISSSCSTLYNGLYFILLQKLKMEKKKHFAVLILVLLCEIAAKDFPTRFGILKYNCFLDQTENSCESAIAQWDGIYYACEMVIDLDFIIKKIGFVDNLTLVYRSNSATYAIDEIKGEATTVDKVIPPIENIVDINNNKYFLANGSNYIILNSTGQVKEIITGNNSLNQLAINDNGSTLFILNPREREITDSNRGGDVYVLDLVPRNFFPDRYEARLDILKKHITAISTLNGKLLLALRTVKLIKLRRINVYSDPCNINVGKGIRSLSMHYIEFLSKSCEDRVSNLAASSPFYNDTLNSMAAENIELKIKLEVAQVNCHTNKSNSQVIKTGSGSTRNASPEDEIDYEFPPMTSNTYKRSGNAEECPPAYGVELANSNWKARLKLMKNKFENLVSSIDALNQEFEEKPVPVAEEEESYEKGYRRPKKCLEAYQLNALTDNIEQLEEVEKDLRQKLLEYTKESKTVIEEEISSPEEDEFEGDQKKFKYEFEDKEIGKDMPKDKAEKDENEFGDEDEVDDEHTDKDKGEFEFEDEDEFEDDDEDEDKKEDH